MPRPFKCRRVAFRPGVTYFKPAGIPLRELEEVTIPLEEAEALRLKDIEGLEQEQGAERMNISRPTFQRILASARKKIADAILNGKAIRIEGGNFEFTIENNFDRIKGEKQMKIAISSIAPNLDADIDQRFGRCQYFVIVDPGTMEFEVLENSSATAGGGAGIATAQQLAGKGIEVVITGNCGPNAYNALAAAGIKVVTNASGNVKEAVRKYQTGELKASSQANVTPHFGSGGRGMGGGMGRGMGRQ
jgi:predicted DNA-binding protein (UPF0251 family)/predicted Fe-Mo cluster-binding NifX family protein